MFVSANSSHNTFRRAVVARGSINSPLTDCVAELILASSRPLHASSGASLSSHSPAPFKISLEAFGLSRRSEFELAAQCSVFLFLVREPKARLRSGRLADERYGLVGPDAYLVTDLLTFAVKVVRSQLVRSAI